MAWPKGKPRSAQTRARMSAASKAALADPAVRAKMSAARKAAWADPAVRAKMSAARKAAWAERDALRAERDEWQARYLDMHKRGTWKDAQEYSEYWRVCAGHEETRRRKAEEKCNALQAERDALRAALDELVAVEDEKDQLLRERLYGRPHAPEYKAKELDHRQRRTEAWRAARALLKEASK